jgi:hypothetical protein
MSEGSHFRPSGEFRFELEIKATAKTAGLISKDLGRTRFRFVWLRFGLFLRAFY